MGLFKKLLKQRSASLLVSVILGLGLATVFQKVCDGNCVVITAPGSEYVTSKVWKTDDVCVKYKPKEVECDKTAIETTAA